MSEEEVLNELILKALELKYSPEELNRLMQKWVNRITDDYYYVRVIKKNGRLSVYG
ncbi:hypothetical protein [Phosphitispora fastidiosa]|uniref:hypothetical protein n=1 Tax=Phosphitispora fastidiosa TaxID=2837202 RepID=UPI001E35D6DC|nr:hypothetical protein [Phosphitispora fastidiosa]MBU7007983.1 hypothetical protein [Phosphitispora fastidiosa]